MKLGCVSQPVKGCVLCYLFIDNYLRVADYKKCVVDLSIDHIRFGHDRCCETFRWSQDSLKHICSYTEVSDKITI